MVSICAACAGCEGEKAPTSTAHPFAGQTVTVAVPKSLDLAESWKPLLDEWAAETGAQSRLVEYAPVDKKEFQVPEADVLLFPFSRLGDLTAADRLGRFPQGQVRGEPSAVWLDYFSGLRERVLSPGGAPAIAAVSCPVLTCYFRRDLLQKANLKAPQTWEEYESLAMSVKQWAPGLTVVEPWGPEYRVTTFLARALPLFKHPGTYSVFFDIDTGAPLIDSPGFVRALEQSLRAVREMPARVKTFSAADCRNEILTGKAALALSFEPGAPEIKPLRRGDSVSIGFAPLPGSHEFYSRRTKSWEKPTDHEVNVATLAPFEGLAAGVMKAVPSERAAAAWNLLTFLVVTRYDQAFDRVPKSLCRESQLASSVGWLGPDLRPEEVVGYLGVTAESLRQTNLSAELPVLGHEEFRQALADGLTATLDGKTSPDVALKQVAQRWSGISDSLGVQRVRDSYRKCLGLPPAINSSDLNSLAPPVHPSKHSPKAD